MLALISVDKQEKAVYNSINRTNVRNIAELIVMDLKMKGHPPICCPDCNARLLNAGDKSVKNGTQTEIVRDFGRKYEYIIRCPKCGSYIGIIKREPSSYQ